MVVAAGETVVGVIYEEARFELQVVFTHVGGDVDSVVRLVAIVDVP